MSNAFKLSRILLKNNFATSKRSLLLTGLVVICLLPTLMSLYALDSYLIGNLLALQALSLTMIAGSAICFFVGFFAIPTLFFFSTDTRFLAGLPLTARDIALARLIVLIVTSVPLSLLPALPLLVSWIQLIPFNPVRFVLLLLGLIANPIMVLLALSCLFILLGAFLPLFANRDRFVLISSVAALVLALATSLFTMQGFENNLEGMLMAESSLFEPGFFFWIPLLIWLILDISWPALAITFLVVAGLFVLYIFLAEKFYLKAALSNNEKARQVKKQNKVRNPYLSYVIIESKNLLRSPTYLFNLVLAPLVVPIYTGVILSISLGEEGLEISDLISYFNLNASFFILLGLITGLIVSAVCFGCATAISRMGTRFYMMKIFPIQLRDQILLKTIPNLVICTISNLLLGFVMIYIFKAGFVDLILYFLMAELALIPVNLLSILVDCYRPKLVWDNETMVAKNNLNTLFSMVFSFLLAGLGFLWLYAFGFGLSSVLLLAAALAVLDILLLILIPKIGAKQLLKIQG